MIEILNFISEKLIGIFGLISLLMISWLLSYHKKNVNFKLILWGLMLQIIFGIIILKSGLLSFIGMSILSLLIINYIFKDASYKYRFILSCIFGLTLFIPLFFHNIALAIADIKFPIPVAFETTKDFNIIYKISTFIDQELYIISNLIHTIHIYLYNYINIILIVFSLFCMLALIINKMLISSKLLKEPRSNQLSKYSIYLIFIFILQFLYINNIDGNMLFEKLSNGIAYFLDLGNYGSRFLFSNLGNDQYMGPWMDEFPNKGNWPGFGFQFAFIVLPTIIFFGGFMSSMYYLGIMQKIINTMSKFMRWSMGTSGAETLSCSANIFVGQTEAPLLVKPFLDKMTKSELLTIMVGGFATIAGGVLAGYIAMGVPAGHILAASVMSAPAALVIGKIIYPETEESETSGNVKLPKIESGSNLIESATNGITDGLKLAVNVGAMLVGFISLIAIFDLILNTLDFWIDGWLHHYMFYSSDFLFFEDFKNIFYYPYEINGLLSPAQGEFRGIFPGSLKTLFGTILKPLAFLLGVPWEDAAYVGNLLGIKLSINEFVAFSTFTQYINSGLLSERSIIIASYALCGFANFSSIGIQIGGLSAIAPQRKKDLAQIGLKAMIGGAIASWITATIAGIIL